ncbi:sigma-54-dependent transcriptional regulator [Sphingomonas montanisoli]|uniref:Sigma-54-dependent Fis family transcriptional regulator n=1 Tax=Sphingomonas montanisoli TaxID=2606412 RepID=A0A5D9CF80_9SPHN|nr:sigma-54 dependent transcriptional regulator [Sphingomonas montanisoli]TZG28781.1 sigma-54-dependent Fis family transcriptional regulator [Sphingomonas montanisoli]
MANGRFDLAVVIDDDQDILLAARLALRDHFAEVLTTPVPEEGLRLVAQRSPDVVLLDANFARGATDGSEGFLWLDRIVKADPDAVVVLITAHAGVQMAVEAMKRGATDFVSKPWLNERLVATVSTAARLRRSRRATGVERAKLATLSAAATATPLLGTSPAMRHVHSLIERAAPTEANVLILGENGTGKELVAREIHNRSRRASAAMVSVDMGAVTENLIDSELFGHVKGAFTDARADRVGRLQAADGGTLFLDEIGNLPLHLQPKLLTALEQRQVTPVGANRPVPIDVRVVSATNVAPDRLTDERAFRADLLFRLNTVEIHLPPLRDRREDIPLLLAHFIDIYRRRYDAPERELPSDLIAALQEHAWPGNVRALRHAAERAVILAQGDAYELADFPLARGATPVRIAPESISAETGDFNLERAERQMIERALKKHAYNISAAATDLGLTRGSLYRRMEKHGL